MQILPVNDDEVRDYFKYLDDSCSEDEEDEDEEEEEEESKRVVLDEEDDEGSEDGTCMHCVYCKRGDAAQGEAVRRPWCVWRPTRTARSGGYSCLRRRKLRTVRRSPDSGIAHTTTMTTMYVYPGVCGAMLLPLQEEAAVDRRTRRGAYPHARTSLVEPGRGSSRARP